ncbi:hypothetical protein DXT99_08275 [Pontibacter diazotrophicus]|uniref:Uncharacterized protein n=1 Tax=Pontibacter diazotrophicus TaxID=1400979 RepID=A0A3D8LEX4_9BACT|nr:hypothetical protein [Pontibacter diazotrophicus]RDV15482.1 hypothetical protein DXT99_08275 [Pontibacter diazotrophicus]
MIQLYKAIFLLFKIVALISDFIMRIIIGLIRYSKFPLIMVAIVIVTLPLYLAAIFSFLISVGMADLLKREIDREGFYPEREGLKDFGYYLSYGSEKKG